MFSFRANNFDACLRETPILVIALYVPFPEIVLHTTIRCNRLPGVVLPKPFILGDTRTFYFRPNVDTIAWRV